MGCRDVEFTLVRADEVDRVWPLFADRMAKACRSVESVWTEPELHEFCRAGDLGLMVGRDSREILVASVWQCQDIGSRRRLACVMLCGKDMMKWARAHEKFAIKVGRALGASALRGEGRKAYERLFPMARPVRIIYEQEL